MRLFQWIAFSICVYCLYVSCLIRIYTSQGNRLRRPVLQLIIAADERYLAGAIGTLASVRLSSPLECGISVWFMHAGLSRESQDRVYGAMARLRNAPEITFIEIEDPFADFPAFFFPSKLAYARLLIPKLVQEGRWIYLDSDFLVLKDLIPITESDLSASGLGAVVDRAMPTLGDDPSLHSIAEHLLSRPYFNSGLLVLDVGRICQTGVFDKAEAVLSEHPEQCRFHDQTALNYGACGSFSLLDPTWNVQAHDEHFNPVESIGRLLDRAINVHFVTRAKPWMVHSPFSAQTMFRMLLDAVDPAWQQDCYSVAAERASRWDSIPWFAAQLFRFRAEAKRSLCLCDGGDRMISEHWRRKARHLRRLRSRRRDVERLYADWKATVQSGLR